jgi:hypothetical protein
VWGLSAGTIGRALWNLGDNVKELAIPADALDRPDYDDDMTATKLLQDTHLIPWLWKVDGYSLIADTEVGTQR